MLTKLRARNFKCFEEVEIALGNPVVLIGPNNSGKTTVLQALALWSIGLQRWQEKRSDEARLDPGALNVRIGEGRTAEVLRNLCYIVSQNQSERWDERNPALPIPLFRSFWCSS